jgi:hypothetical protein
VLRHRASWAANARASLITANLRLWVDSFFGADGGPRGAGRRALVVHCEGDFIDVANARWIAQSIPDARLVTFPGGTHVPAAVAGR